MLPRPDLTALQRCTIKNPRTTRQSGMKRGIFLKIRDPGILQMYGSDAGQPPQSLYTKGLSPLCDLLTYTCACTYAYRLDIHTTQSPAFMLSVSYIYATLPCICTVTAPWDYALRMACNNKLSALHITCIVIGNSSRFLDLPVRMMKTSATCSCQAWTTQ